MKINRGKLNADTKLDFSCSYPHGMGVKRDLLFGSVNSDIAGVET